jgi:formylglycine-generating enzyme required for sulfatase activity
MVVIPAPVEFVMGSPLTETGRYYNERQRWKRLPRPFALAATAVTVGNFQAYYRLKFGEEYNYIKQQAPTSDCPAHWITWFMAAQYCNWLSEQEKLPNEQWCYEADANGNVTKLKENYLRLQGYRLPTEAEWEYACRAGSGTSRYYGATEELLGYYAWYDQNSENRTWPVGTKKPNDWGLFDMHGNIWTWCQEVYRANLASGAGNKDDIEDILTINRENSRVLRGGAFLHRAVGIPTANRVVYGPSVRSDYVGFRPARTLPLAPLTASPATAGGGGK